MSGHTPGPWTVDRVPMDRMESELLSNARLMAAAPAMRIKWPLELLAVLALSVPACAACALVFRGRQR